MRTAFFSNQFASRQGHGIARYARHLYRALTALEDGPEVVPVSTNSNRDPESLAQLQADTGLQILPWGRRWTPAAWTFLGGPAIESWMSGPVDVVHVVAPGFPVATKKPLVVTIHDIGPLTHPDYFGDEGWKMKRALKQAVKQAAMLVCVSQATADELQEYVQAKMGVNLADRIRVVHEGVGEEFFERVDLNGGAEAIGIDLESTPFILCAGSISPRKNVHGIIKALGRLKDDIPHHLVAVGGEGWNVGEVKAELERSGMKDRVHLAGYVSDEMLRHLYHRAQLYVYPSFFEGFGLPVLEAMAAGCPVVTSSVSSLPEIAGDAALLADPSDSDELAAAMRRVCTDQPLRAELKVKGEARARSFTWERCARQIAQVYQDVC